MPMLAQPVAVRLKVPASELVPTVPPPVPDAVQPGAVGAPPAGAERLKPAWLPPIVAVSVPGSSVPMAGFTRRAGPDAVLPDWVAVHVKRTAVPLTELPICPVQVPVRSAGGSEGDVESPPQAAQTINALARRARAIILEP